MGVLEQGDVELVRQLAEARELVGAGGLRGEPAAPGTVGLVPAQVLQRQPAGALHEAALDLAEVDERGQAVADVVHDVDPAGAVGAGEAVDLDLGRRDAVGEVLERVAAHPRGVPVDALGPVEAGRPQLHPAEVGLADQLLPRQAAARRRPSRSRARICSQASLTAPPLRSAPELAAVAEVLGTLSVRVGASRTLVEGHAEGRRRDLEHLGVQPLAHLGAAVVDQHRAVLVDVHQRAGLVEGGEVERDAELHRRDRQPALGVRVRGVEGRDLRLPARHVGRREHLVPRRRRAARGGAPAGRRAWPGPRRRSCGGAGRPGRSRAAGRSGRGRPRPPASPAARRSRGTRSARSCGCARPGRAGGRAGSSRRCRRGTAPAPAPAR